MVYRGPAVSSVCLFPDLFALQLVCLFTKPDNVLDLLVRRYGLFSWLSSTLQPMTPARETERVLAEELLRLIISIVCDRTMCEVSSRKNIRREIINMYALLWTMYCWHRYIDAVLVI
jgi:hypothetical protein